MHAAIHVKRHQINVCFKKTKSQAHTSNQIRVVAFNITHFELTQASFLQKNQTLQNVMLRWHRASVAIAITSKPIFSNKIRKTFT